MNTTTTHAATFESATCTRCEGSGKFSFNQMDGDRCYGCGGTGVKLTKRGVAARAHYLSLLQRPVSEIAVGDSVYEYVGLSNAKRWLKIASIRPDTLNGGFWLDLNYKGKPSVTQGVGANATLACVTTEEQRIGFLAAAIEYQGTLTKLGKPSARKRG